MYNVISFFSTLYLKLKSSNRKAMIDYWEGIFRDCSFNCPVYSTEELTAIAAEAEVAYNSGSLREMQKVLKKRYLCLGLTNEQFSNFIKFAGFFNNYFIMNMFVENLMYSYRREASGDQFDFFAA